MDFRASNVSSLSASSRGCAHYPPKIDPLTTDPGLLISDLRVTIPEWQAIVEINGENLDINGTLTNIRLV